MRPFLASAVLFALSPAAHAACEAPYDTAALSVDLVAVEDALRVGDPTTALSGAEALVDGLGCMTEPIPYVVAPRVYRAIGAAHTLSGYLDVGHRWLLTAIELQPGFSYGLEDLPPDSTLHGTVDRLRETAEVPPVDVEDTALVAGRHYLDGSLLGGARATTGRPHLYQTDAGGAFRSVIIDGNGFPADTLTAAAVADVSTVAMPVVPEFVPPMRPPEKTALLIGGGVVMLGSGVVYALAINSRQQFDEAQTVEQADRYGSLTNTLVVTSAGVFAAGAGVLTWGIIVGDRGTPAPKVSVRF